MKDSYICDQNFKPSKLKTFFTLTLLFISFSIFSESTAERLKRVKERTLIVELPIKDTKYIAKLIEKGKQTEADDYEKRHKRVTEALKTSFSKFWAYNEKVVFVPSDSIVPFMNGYPQHYAIIRYGERLRFLLDKPFTNYLAPYDGERYMSLCLPGEMKEVLFCLTPRKAALGEFIVSLHQFNDAIEVYLSHPKIEQTYVNAYTASREEKPRYETKDLTLLIKREDIDVDKVNAEKIAKVYPYKYKIVDTKEWEDAILNRTPGFACYVTYVATITQTLHYDTNHNGNPFEFSDQVTENKRGIILRGVFVAHNGHGELATLGKDLPKEMAEFKKQLDKFEKKANQPKKD